MENNKLIIKDVEADEFGNFIAELKKESALKIRGYKPATAKVLQERFAFSCEFDNISIVYETKAKCIIITAADYLLSLLRDDFLRSREKNKRNFDALSIVSQSSKPSLSSKSHPIPKSVVPQLPKQQPAQTQNSVGSKNNERQQKSCVKPLEGAIKPLPSGRQAAVSIDTKFSKQAPHQNQIQKPIGHMETMAPMKPKLDILPPTSVDSKPFVCHQPPRPMSKKSSWGTPPKEGNFPPISTGDKTLPTSCQPPSVKHLPATITDRQPSSSQSTIGRKSLPTGRKPSTNSQSATTDRQPLSTSHQSPTNHQRPNISLYGQQPKKGKLDVNVCRSPASVRQPPDKSTAITKPPPVPQKTKKAVEMEKRLKKLLPTAFEFLCEQSKTDFIIGMTDITNDHVRLSDYSMLLVPLYRALERLIFDLQQAEGINVKMIGQGYEKDDAGRYILKSGYQKRIASIIYGEVMAALYTEYFEKRNFYAHSDITGDALSRVITDKAMVKNILAKLIALIEYNAKKLKEIDFSLRSI